jgi:hypothetical protein
VYHLMSSFLCGIASTFVEALNCTPWIGFVRRSAIISAVGVCDFHLTRGDAITNEEISNINVLCSN